METWLFFCDETGNYRKDEYVIRGGFLIEISRWIELSEKILSLKTKCFSGLSKYKEIKWSDITTAIYFKEKKWKISRKKSFFYLSKYSIKELENYLKKFFNLLSKFEPLSLNTISAKKNRIMSEEILIKWQLQELMQRVEMELQDDEDRVGIMIFDEIGKPRDLVIKTAYKDLLEQDVFVKEYQHLLDSLFFEVSRLSAGVQGADYIVGALCGCLRSYSLSRILYEKYIYSILRKGSRGEVWGYGLREIPSDSKIRRELDLLLHPKT